MSACFYNEAGSCWLLKKKKRFHSSQEGLFSIPNKEARVIVSKKLNYCEIMG